MGVTTHPYVPVSDAPYPVINAQPTFFATFRNLTLGDYFLFLSMTTLGAGYGFAAGARALFCACAQARLDACCIRHFFRAALLTFFLCILFMRRQAAAPPELLLHRQYHGGGRRDVFLPRVVAAADGAAPQPERVRTRRRRVCRAKELWLLRSCCVFVLSDYVFYWQPVHLSIELL